MKNDITSNSQLRENDTNVKCQRIENVYYIWRVSLIEQILKYNKRARESLNIYNNYLDYAQTDIAQGIWIPFLRIYVEKYARTDFKMFLDCICFFFIIWEYLLSRDLTFIFFDVSIMLSPYNEKDLRYYEITWKIITRSYSSHTCKR